MTTMQSRIEFAAPPPEDNRAPVSIAVIGVGGGGGNAVNTMVESGLRKVTVLAANTDQQALSSSRADGVLAIGQALTRALGDKKGIRRYGECHLPMDDAQVRCALDLSARPFLIWNVDLPTQKIGTFDTELVREFFQALSTHGGITLHVDQLHGFNSHHIAEAAFKSVARALRVAVETDPRKGDAIPSTKGAL